MNKMGYLYPLHVVKTLTNVMPKVPPNVHKKAPKSALADLTFWAVRRGVTAVILGVTAVTSFCLESRP